jgi:hypothetical protein
MQQLFQNLLSNALKYTKPGVTPEMQITIRQVRGRDAKANISIENHKGYIWAESEPGRGLHLNC